jgi:cell division protein FtsA
MSPSDRESAPGNLAAALDLGTSRTTCWIGERDREGVRLLAAGRAPSEGVSGGEVVDVVGASGSVRAAIWEAEAQSGLAVEGLTAAVSGAAVSGTVGRAAVPITREGQVVTPADAQRAAERAARTALPQGATTLQVLPHGFLLDGAGPIQDPVGLACAVLEAEVVALSASTFAVENLTRAVREAGRHADSFVAAPAALGTGALTPEERELGALVLDIGAATAEFSAWTGGGLRAAGCVELGGESVTRDVALGLGVSRATAEGLKREAGAAHAASLGEIEAARALSAPSLGGEEPAIFTRLELAEIVEARVEEILLLVRRRLLREVRECELGAGVVLAGGTACLADAAEKAAEVFGVRARAARPRLEGGPGSGLDGPEAALGAGLLLWATEAGLPAGEDLDPRPVRWLAGAVRWLAAGF